MSHQLDRRVLTFDADPAGPVRSLPSPADPSDHQALDRLAGWLAEVSAEDARRRLMGEAEPPAREPTS